MSVFDEERKKLGLTKGSTKTTTISAFDAERMELGLIKDTREKPKAEVKKQPQTQAQANVSTKLSDTLASKVPLASALNTKNAFGNNAVVNFNDKVPAASLLMAGEGGPSNASKIKELTQYDINNEEIKNAPPVVKQYAQAMNYLAFGNPVGKAISRSFAGNSGATQRDSTGNEAVDKVTDVINNVVTPFITPTGAPLGQGILGSSYDTTAQLLTSKTGQKLLKGAGKVIPGSEKVVREAVTEGLAGGVQGAAFGLQQGQDSGSEIARNVLWGAGGGAVLAGAGSAVGEALSKVFSKVPKATQTKVKQSPYEGLTREQRIYKQYLDDVPLSKADADFMVSSEWNEANLNVKPKETPFAEIPAEPKGAEVPIPKQNEEILSKNIEDFTPEDIESLVASTVETPTKPVIPVKEVEPVTKAVEPKPNQRGFTETLKASNKTPEPVKTKLDNEYTPITNLDTVEKANARIAKDIDTETSKILSLEKFDAESSVTAQRLMDHYNKQGNYAVSLDIADKIATEATKAGQFIQSLSIYDRLTPEGVLLKATRIAKKVNETGSKLGKAAEVTPKMAEEITQLAGITQKMVGVKDLSVNVIDILERAKGGAKLTADEADQLQKFVAESKQFIKESTTKPKKTANVRQPKDKRVRDNLASFLDEQEKAAKERIKARGNRVSSTPLDIWADYAIIGASKMGKNVVKFADWSESMVKDLGENIRPHLEQLYEKSKEAFTLSSKKISRQTISEAEKLTQKVIKEKQITADEAESLLNIAQRVSSLSGEAKRVASQDLQTILQSLDKPTFLRKVASVQTQAQLLNPKTQVRNVLGNELFYRLERINKYVSTPIDIVRSKLTGTDRTVTFRTFNQGKYWDNWIKGGSAGARGVNINGLETQFDLASPAFTGKYNPLRYTEKALGASLRSFDNAAYMRAVNKNLGEIATLDAINNGVKPSKAYVQNFIAKADDNVRQMADTYGKYVTFQDNNVISQGLTKLKRGMNLNKDFGFGDLILKYPKTPGALLMRALEYSPAGFIRSAMQIAKPLYKHGVEKDPAAVVQGLSRAIVGTFGLSGLGYYLIDNDIITGQASKDTDVRSLQAAAGKGAYQVNLSALDRFVRSGFDKAAGKIKEGDLLYTYDWMQPVSIAISLGANTKQALSGEGEKGNIASGIGGSVYDAISGSVNTLTEQSVLQGLQRAAEGYPGQSTLDKAADILSDVPASFVPTLFNQVKQLTDNSKRETTDPTLLEKSLNKAQAKFPGLASKLPKKYDTLGNEQKHYQNNSAANVFLNPGFPTRYKLSDEARMIVDLIAETEDDTIAPRVSKKKINGKALTGEEFSRLSQLQGEKTKKRLGTLDQTLTTKSKVKSINKKLTKSGDEAKKQLLKEFPRLGE